MTIKPNICCINSSADNSLPRTQTTLFALSCSSLPAVKLCPSLMIVTVTEIFDCGQRGSPFLLPAPPFHTEEKTEWQQVQSAHCAQCDGVVRQQRPVSRRSPGRATAQPGPSMARYNLIAVRAVCSLPRWMLAQSKAAWNATTTQH
jgi:hypothetical protein